MSCENNIVTEGALPSDAFMCWTCCLSHDQITLAANQCVHAGDIVQLDPTTNEWRLVASPLANPLPVGTQFAIVFCKEHSTMNGVPSKCTAVVRLAKFVPGHLNWPAAPATPLTAAERATIMAAFASNMMFPVSAA